MNNPKFVVNNIIGEDKEGYSRVTIANDLFNAVRGMRPEIAFTDLNDKDSGARVRRFVIENVELFAIYSKEDRKTIFIMKTLDAKTHYIPFAQQIADGPKSPFNLSDFDRTFKTSQEVAEEANALKQKALQIALKQELKRS